MQFFYWMALASVQGYASFFLLDAGISNTKIGLLLAAAAAMSAVIQPLMASYADRPKSLSVRVMTIAMSALMLAGALLLLAFFRRNIAATAGLYFAIQLVLLLQQPFLNAIGTESINSGRKLNFGLARAFGSFGYTAGAFLLGRFSENLGPVIIPAAIAVSSLAMGVFTGIYPLKKHSVGAEASDASGEEKVTASAGTAGSFFHRYPQYTVALAALILIFLGHIYINNYLLQIVESKGGTSGVMGNIMSFAAVLELTIMLVYGWLRKMRPDCFWFRLSGVFFTLKVLMTLLAPNAEALFLVQLLQPFGWGLISVSAVYYINGMMDAGDKIKGQAFYTSVFTIGNVLGNLTAGLLLDHGGVTAMLLTGTAVSAAGTILLLLSARARTSGVTSGVRPSVRD